LSAPTEKKTHGKVSSHFWSIKYRNIGIFFLFIGKYRDFSFHITGKYRDFAANRVLIEELV
jgi:hypothetical protein